jgi:hypothetical protein
MLKGEKKKKQRIILFLPFPYPEPVHNYEKMRNKKHIK